MGKQPPAIMADCKLNFNNIKCLGESGVVCSVHVHVHDTNVHVH